MRITAERGARAHRPPTRVAGRHRGDQAMARRLLQVALTLLLLPGTAAFGRLLNASSAEVCAAAQGVCACSELAPGCGWCSSSKSCRPASECTTTCRECPSTHKTCR
eukprot:2698880-Prymnesium_polylepis.1